MTDRRQHPANGRVAALHLQGQVTADRFVQGTAAQVAVPVADLLDAPEGARERQKLLGEAVTVYEDRAGWSFVQGADGYTGYIISTALRAPDQPTHRVASFATHAYHAADLKSGDRCSLPFGARVRVTDERKAFAETPQGFVPKGHLRPLERPFGDPVTLAQLHFNVPYLWGGNSTRGIDCSGLVQAAFLACDLPCPADSDMQCDALGQPLAEDAPRQRGDLIFWEGHVGIMVDADTLIHANAHHMAVAYEPLDRAIRRIEAQGDGAVIARKRP